MVESKGEHPRSSALILHLERARQRSAQVDILARKCPVATQIVTAIDGRNVDKIPSFQRYRRRLVRPYYPFSLRQAEIATFLSHRLCWQTIVDQNLDYAFVFEDDVDIDADRFLPALKLAQAHIQPGDFIRFAVKPREKTATVIAQEGAVRLFVPMVTGLGMQGQLISRGAAKTLLEKSSMFDRPVDVFLQMTWITEIRMLSVAPSGLAEISDGLGGSLIWGNKTITEKAVHEVVRPFYRLLVAARARKTTLRT